MRPAAALAVDRFPPVGLAEVHLRAPAMTRIDRKYALPRESLPHLLDELARLAGRGTEVQVLEIDGAREFRYRSTYHDTADLLAFRAAGQRRRRRFKVRTRSYVDTGARFLDVKTRGPRGMTVKDRLEVHVDGALTGPAAEFVDACLAGAGIGPVAERLEPTLTTAYSRTTFVHDEHRMTVDTDLSWALEEWWPGPSQAGCSLEHLAIVETKAGTSPTVFDRLLWRSGRRPVRLSKYGTGLLLLRPDLPHLKWHRALARNLTPALDTPTSDHPTLDHPTLDQQRTCTP